MYERDDSTPPRLATRPSTGHKGTFGTVCVVGGCINDDSIMLGAPSLAALGALRAGAGLVKLMMPAPLLAGALSVCPSATGVPMEIEAGDIDVQSALEDFDEIVRTSAALVIGPGLGRSRGAAALTIRGIQQEDAPAVIDADALNVLAETPDFWLDFRAAAVLTPHPGEFRRLAAAVRISGDPTDDATRPDLASALARKLGCIVALKGARSVVSDGVRAWTCERGHVCMATGGTGDVLAGAIAGVIASQKELSLYDAARIGVLAHAIAGERWAQSNHASGGMLATELAAELPQALEVLR